MRWGGAGLASALTLAIGGQALAAEPGAMYNGTMPGQTHGGPTDTDRALLDTEVSQCIKVAHKGKITAWLAGGASSGYRFDGLRWGGGRRKTCRDGQVRVQRLPGISVGPAKREMYFQRGGAGTAPYGRTRDRAIRHAHIWVGDLAARPSVFDIRRRPIYPNGRPCTATVGLYRTAPRVIPGYYKSLSQVRRQRKKSNETADWKNYGDPSSTEGTQFSRVPFNYLLWNWRWDNSSGGGQVRASLEAGTYVRRCDVAAITSNMYGKNSDRVVGYVRGIYGRISDTAGADHHGWLVHSYRPRNSKTWIYLLAPA